VDLPAPAQQLFARRYRNASAPWLALDPKNAQYSAAAVLEQYVRSLPTYVEDPVDADVVFVPFYPIFYGMHRHIYPGNLTDTASALKRQLLPAIAALPASAALVFVTAHVDAYPHLQKHFLSQIRPDRPRRIITLRTDMGDTTCACYGRPFWGDGLENILIPYAVMVPPEFISQEARRAGGEAEADRNATLFFRAGVSLNPHRQAAVAGLQALKRPDVDVALAAVRPAEGRALEKWAGHAQYLGSLMRSKFCLVTEGDVSTTLRLYEAIVAGCVPVILSDCMDVAFDGLAPVGPYPDFSLRLPRATAGADVAALLDGLVASGGYARLRARLEEVWPHFTFHNGSLPQPTAAALVMRQVFDAVRRMRHGLPPLSDMQAGVRRHCPQG
jgi:hypothetical protein